jgi:carboxypeptidase C (cathepsin A)
MPRSRIVASAACIQFFCAHGVAFAQAPPSWFDPTRIDDSPAAPATRTHHEGVFNGRSIEYDAITGETVLLDEDGRPASTIFSTAYLRTDVADDSARPVLFLFNGGPGASSSPLHLGVGPVRRPPSDDTASLVANEPSPLDTVDMVFVDPAGTGYSRIYREGAGEAFWGIEEDAESILFFLNDWLVTQGRTSSPVFLFGESYGTVRAVTVVARAKNVEFSGVLLLSPALDMSAGTRIVGNNLPYVFLLPTMAATAAYHGVTERGELSFRAVFERAAMFAQTEYATALFSGALLDRAERDRVAAELARLTGLSKDYVLTRNLRVDSADFIDAVLADRGLRVGRLDTRITGRTEDYRDNRPPTDDPSMSGRGGGRSNGELLDEYFRTKLGTRIERPYRTLNLDLNAKWNYAFEGAPRFYLSVVPLLEESMRNRPDLEIFIGGGVFDLGTPVMASRYLASQMDVDQDRFTFVAYEGGHSVFNHEESRIRLSDDIRDFVASTLAAADGGRAN